ncbi:AraC family transcriptional regulator [candidate division KSB1 bacterium]|nr:AraC family transcriptional regulator [candidate division KSB1 bacterium]
MSSPFKLIFSSSLFHVLDIQWREQIHDTSNESCLSDFYITFPRQGCYGYRVGSRVYECYSGVLHLENAGVEATFLNDRPNACTSLQIEADLLKEVGWSIGEGWKAPAHSWNADFDFRFPMVTIPSTPEIEYLHGLIYRRVLAKKPGELLQLEDLLIHLLERMFGHLANKRKLEAPMPISKRELELYLPVIERGKAYIHDNFQKEMGLAEIARHAFLSPYHFSRLFRHYTSFSPHQYLLEVRLSHAVRLLLNTSLAVTEVGFDSGFNSLDHFIATFTRRYRMSPLKFRRCKLRSLVRTFQ